MLKFLGSVTLVCLAVAVLIGLAGGREAVAPILVIWILFCITFTLVIYKACVKNSAYLDVYSEKGPCRESIEEFCKANIYGKANPTVLHKLQLASNYLVIGEFDRAGEIYNTVSLTDIHDDYTKAIYFNDYLAYVLTIFRVDLAEQTFAVANDFMQIYIKKKPIYRYAWFDNYLVLLMEQGRYDEAVNFAQGDMMSKDNNDLTAVELMISLAAGAALNGREEDERRFTAQVRMYLDNFTHYEFAWQKQLFLNKLELYLNRAHAQRQAVGNQNLL